MRREFESKFMFSAMQATGKTLKGVHAAKQSRSQAKHQALLESGRRLLDAHDLGTLSVAQLTRDAGMSVGSFYSRFEDKDAWFAELLRVTGEQALRDTQALLDGSRFAQASHERKAALIVRRLVAIHRTHRGIFRAAHSDSARSQLYWTQLHAYGQRLADAVYRALAPDLRQVPPAQRRLRVGIALQLVFGTLVNAVLHNPGPIGLHDKRMEVELSRVFLAALRLG
jgi:AcrR family transcriptional regulator